ncbi:unnamed protein product [Mytilus edulis]|uniref:B box-type domain-containing protein n=1 Tax=Mytilus edulis TaxID=6550 RepID=A0A8S3VIB1_MYTED|nr:unnamed protein product [Mytilus edulis]
MADSNLKTKDQIAVGCSDNQESSSNDISFRGMKCKEHTMKGCSFYCKDCKEFICDKCITKAHKEHDVVDEEDYNTELNELLKTQKETEIELSKMSWSKVSPITSGSAEVRDKTEQQQKPEIKVIRQFATDSTLVYGLTTCSGDFMLMMLNDYVYGNLNYMYQAGGYTPHMQIKSCKCFRVFDIAVDSTNNILLSVQGESVLRVFNVTTKQISNSNYNVAPLITQGIHVTRERKVIIGCVTPEARGKQVVIVMDEAGNHVNQYDFDDNTKEALFTEPCRISSTSNGNICVVDLDQSPVGRIVVLQQAGNIKQVYHGHQDRPFKPTDILTTPLDNIVVTDCYNHTLHILSCDGVFITYIKTEDLGITAPYCLAYSGSGTFYIGCSTRSEWPPSVQAKIFQVQYSGF